MAEEIFTFNTDKHKSQVITYEKLELVSEYNKILATPTIPFDFTNRENDPVHIAQSMFKTMLEKKGIGLAANQVGLNHSVFTVGMDDTNKQVFFNPKVIELSDEMVKHQEGCLSYPGLFMKVERPKWVKLQFQHVNGQNKEETFHGLTARIVLHEYDHIQGKLFTKSVGPVTLRMAQDKRRKK